MSNLLDHTAAEGKSGKLRFELLYSQMSSRWTRPEKKVKENGVNSQGVMFTHCYVWAMRPGLILPHDFIKWKYFLSKEYILLNANIFYGMKIYFYPIITLIKIYFIEWKYSLSKIYFIEWKYILLNENNFIKCAVPENIHTPPMEGFFCFASPSHQEILVYLHTF